MVALWRPLSVISEKKFGFRVRVEVKITQKDSRLLKNLAREFNMGKVSCNRRDTDHATHDWIIRDKEDVMIILEYIRPYSRLKQGQICTALKILEKVIVTKKDLLRNARLADSLSQLNVRSKNRRKNFATMVKDSFPLTTDCCNFSYSMRYVRTDFFKSLERSITRLAPNVFMAT